MTSSASEPPPKPVQKVLRRIAWNFEECADMDRLAAAGRLMAVARDVRRILLWAERAEAKYGWPRTSGSPPEIAPDPPGAPGDRGQRAVAYYDALRAAGRPHNTALLDEVSAAAGLKNRRRLEQLLSERNNPK
jgi:hypothetical protein